MSEFEEELNELKLKIGVSQTIHKALKFAFLFLVLMAAQQCAWLYFRSATSFDVALAGFYLIGAAGFGFFYLWASKSGFMERIRKEAAKKRLVYSREAERRDSEK